MDGAGSRLSRASSRYGPTTTVFSGPVRRWKKKWVHVPPPPSSSAFTSRHNSRSSSSSNNDTSSRLMLCRWTPLSSSSAEEPPRRRFRYAPVVVLDEQKKVVEKKIDEMEDVENASEGEESTVLSDKLFGRSNSDQVKKQGNEDFSKKGSQGSTMNNLNLDLGLQGHSASMESMNKMKEAQTKTASSGGFWLQ